MPLFDILAILPEHPRIKIVDIGAMSLGAGTDPYQRLLNTGLVTMVGFEPNRAECAKLQAAATKDRLYLPYAIGDGSRRTLNICNYPMTSSLYEPNLPLADKFQNLGNLMQVVRCEEMETRRLDDLPEVEGTDYLKIDVQGAEVDVMAGARKLLSDVLVVHTEIEFVPLYKNQPLFAEVDQEMRRSGFLFHIFAEIAGRPFKPVIAHGDVNRRVSQMLWGDAVYVKSFMEFDRLLPAQLLKLSIILHVLYESVDLALVALARYDAKMRTKIGIKYLERLTGSPLTPQASAMLYEMSLPSPAT